MTSSAREVDKELIEANILIDSGWVDFTRLAIRDYQFKYFYYYTVLTRLRLAVVHMEAKQFCLCRFRLVMKSF